MCLIINPPQMVRGAGVSIYHNWGTHWLKVTRAGEGGDIL